MSCRLHEQRSPLALAQGIEPATVYLVCRDANLDQQSCPLHSLKIVDAHRMAVDVCFAFEKCFEGLTLSMRQMGLIGDIAINKKTTEM